jgi:CheY-like chemotaxis protein
MTKKLQVLLVEDNAPARKIAETLLKVWGCEVMSVEDGTSGLAASQAQQFDLIYTDLGLPDIDGEEMTQKIRQDANNKNHKTPIYGLTADASREKIDSCLKSGLNDVLKKPITQDIHNNVTKCL